MVQGSDRSGWEQAQAAGFAALRRGDAVAALEQFTRALQTLGDPADGDGHQKERVRLLCSRASALVRLGRPWEAMEQASEAATVMPAAWEVRAEGACHVLLLCCAAVDALQPATVALWLCRPG